MFEQREGRRGVERARLYRLWSVLLIGALIGLTFLPPVGARVARAAPQESRQGAPAPVPGPAPQPLPEAQAVDPATGPIFRPRVAEVAEERSAYSRTRPNPDGSVTTTLSERPMFWRDAKGRWNEFRNELALSQAPGFGQEGRGNGYSVRFGGPAAVAAGKPLIQLSAEGKSIGVSAPGAAPKGCRSRAGASRSRTRIRAGWTCGSRSTTSGSRRTSSSTGLRQLARTPPSGSCSTWRA